MSNNQITQFLIALCSNFFQFLICIINIFDFVLRAMILLLSIRRRKVKAYKPVRYKKVQTLPIRRSSDYITFGNIKYQELTSIAGENYSVKVSLDKLLLLANQPILYSGLIDKNNNIVTITVKKKDKDLLVSLINLSDKQQQLDEQSAKISNKNTYQKLKEIAAQSNEKLSYLVITHFTFLRLIDSKRIIARRTKSKIFIE